MNFFTVTSDKPYNRHSYEIVFKNNKKISFDNWYDTLEYWLQHCHIDNYLDYVNVKDNKKGFKNK